MVESPIGDSGAMFLFGTRGSATRRTRTSSDNAIVGLRYVVAVRDVAPGFPMASGTVLENNRISGNVLAIGVNPAENFAAGSIVADPGNW